MVPPRQGGFSRGGRRGRGQQICHDPGERPEETLQQQQAKADYTSWKRLIKTPPQPNDNKTIERLWSGALTILNGDDRDWKQMLPRDLDDEAHFGREHIRTLLGMKAHAHGHSTFITLARPFLLVITHQALLDCLSVDTAVGDLYNFISGSNGCRAVPFFQMLTSSLEQNLKSATPGPKVILETTLVAMLRSLRELLTREQRAAFHDDLPGLINSMENLVGVADVDAHSVASQVLRKSIAELRGIVGRANGLLLQDEEPQVDGVSTTVVTSTYPRDFVIPQDRHDNDKADITKIKILPTEDEIRSDHAEFLPSSDRDQPHFLADEVERHLDTQFRLLRHDVLGELSQAVGGMMVALEADPTFIENPKLNLGNTRAYVNLQAHIRYVSFERRRGLEVQIAFLQPFPLRKKSSSERRRWWEETKRLEEGILLVFLFIDDAKPSLLFFMVSQKCTDANKDFGLSSKAHLATITAKLATPNQSNLEKLIRLSASNTQGILVEFPGVLPATFVPILESIQNMQRSSRLPFRQWILPDRVATYNDRPKAFDVPPPLYTRSSGFRFSLQPILKDAGDEFAIDPRSPPDDINTIGELERRTNLDRGQCQALAAALTREFAFIQGPPGTGKSYLGVQLLRVLLASKMKADLGPVVVVCYTNHALDQFLEHLIDVGIEKVVRIGGQSKSNILEGKNLRVVSKGESKTKFEGYSVAMAIQAHETQEKKIKKILATLHGSQKRRDWANLRGYLSSTDPLIHRQFNEIEEDGFTTVGGAPFDKWAKEKLPKQSDGASTEPIKQLLAQARANVYSVSADDRNRLVAHWVDNIRDEKSNELFDEVKAADQSQLESMKVYDEVDRRVLQTADVIGVTTSGLAKRIAALQHVRCKVVVCEEAAEVMEPHMLSALLPSVEHFIQIGDHQQLRPQIYNYNLSLESQQGLLYQLDRSQFERLSIGERGRPAFPVAQLNAQRRMRPQISTLIRETVYPRLLDHDSTKNLPDVVGMRKNVFWLDHDHFEEGARADQQQKSQSNLWEVDMTHALVRHIVRQGSYSSTDIAVLTPYTGQLQRLRAKMRNDFEIVLSERDLETLVKEGFHPEEVTSETDQTSNQLNAGMKPLEKKKMSELLRIATVDNFQGEEAKVVIVSLVRSNKERKVGFLKTTNRINVLLSRAQHGMYLIGNTDTYLQIQIFVADRWEPATIPAPDFATTENLVVLVKHHVRFVALTHDVHYSVTNPAHHASRSAYGPANTKGSAICLAPRPVAAFRVPNAALDVYHALTSVLGSAAKNAPKTTVRFVQTERTPGAVIDDMSKRFLVKGQADLRDVERHLVELELDLDKSRKTLVQALRPATAPRTAQLTPAFGADVTKQLKERYVKGTKLERVIWSFLNKVADKHQPAQKLHDATVNAMRRRSVERMMTDLNVVDSVPSIARDRRITLGGRVAQLQAESIILDDRLNIARILKSTSAGALIRLSGGFSQKQVSPEKQVEPFFKSCSKFIDECGTVSLPKLSVEASLYYAGIARSYEFYCRSTEIEVKHASEQVKSARELLEKAKDLCALGFQNADALRKAVEKSIKLLRREWYEEVTAEEIAAVKKAMVSGAGGIATHSGHWYNCVNGHPFAIGECGMPMEQARCPECGAPVGGQGHRPAEGVTRARNMED
ncbi:MAG: hypothetical protein ASARMPRED_006796 [Alectoria sarmentosa]|nr:MAG: hypothetical protein ASARMPRED_006796 [Alectoria sarmentosa]